ncbi:hypothetical protein RN001_003731 [Aquatica leii]|uniref:SAP domain-containing protein n=1 Tax=Aquatica leii TaxID=1421715 RepID=A0AAN7ST30_9COLE|nr:hypothetical protein RN001_003731 [Aquatica leii]
MDSNRTIKLQPEDVPGAVFRRGVNVEDHSNLELRRWLECRALKKVGNKAELVKRIVNCINAGSENAIFIGVDGGKWYDAKRNIINIASGSTSQLETNMLISNWNKFPSVSVPPYFNKEKMDSEKDQRRLQQLLDEEGYLSDTVYDDQSESDNVYNIEEHLDSDSNSEQDGDDTEDKPPAAAPRNKREPSFTAKDGMEWRKHFTRSSYKVRTRQANIVIHLPGVNPVQNPQKLLKNAGVSFFQQKC